MKFKDVIMRTLLVLLIALSLVLSYFIWMNPVKQSEKETTPSTTKVTRAGKTATELFLPAKGIWYQKQERLSTTKENFLNIVQSELIKANYGTLNLASEDGAFATVLKGINGLELDYVGSFLLSEYVDVYGVKLSFASEKISYGQFDRIVLDFDQSKIYFMNTSKQVVYEAAIKIDKTTIVQALQKDKANLIAVNLKHDVLPEQYFVDKAISLPKYNYILATQPYSTFTQALFQTTDDLAISDVGQELSYSNTLGDSLSIENETGKVYFSRTGNTPPDAMSTDNIYKQSYHDVTQLAVSLGNLRYFDAEGEAVLYTTFVEGYPVFSPNFQGQIRLEYHQRVLSKIYSNVESVQIPIPADEKETLPSTVDFLAELSRSGVDLTKLQNVQIGYQWHSVEETSQVVELVPQWFVRYNGQWYSKETLQTYLKEAK